MPLFFEIDARKIVSYLLNAEHPKNQGKAAYFERFGFSQDDPFRLASAFGFLQISHTSRRDVIPRMGLPRVVFEGPVPAPDGRQMPVRTVWEKMPDGKLRFITAVPLTR